MNEKNETFNPEHNPNGAEGALDTNKLPWIEISDVQGLSIKPIRVSPESGMFSLIFKLQKGASFPSSIYLGGMDLLVLSGKLGYIQNDQESILAPGTWGFISANSRVGKIVAHEDSEVLGNFYSGVAFLRKDGSLKSILTGADILAMSEENNISLVPNSLTECWKREPEKYEGPGEPLAIASLNASTLVDEDGGSIIGSEISHPHFVDTREIPWFSMPTMPDIGLKLLRVSEETGFVSMIVRHNGVANPHTHIGASDFLVLSGALGVRAGPPEGYGPGIWFYEPAGARHDETKRVTDEDLIYTANIYGPLVFDSGPGTQIEAVVSWIDYKAMAEEAGIKLVPNSQSNDSTLLAWAPLKSAG
jgi:hypothetical protein